MEYDFFVNRVHGHERYRIGLLKQIQGYEAYSLSSTMIFPSSGWDYLYKHLIEHMILAECKDEAKILLLRLSWLRESIYRRPGRVVDVLKDIALIRNAGGLSNKDEVDVSLKLVDQSIIMSVQELQSFQNRKHQYAAFALNLISRLASLNEESIKYPIIKTRSRMRQFAVFVFKLISHHSSLNKQSIKYPIIKTLTDECMLWMQQHSPLIPKKYKLQGPGGPLEMTLRGHSSWVRSVCISADGSRIISGSHDNTIKIWNAAAGACEMSLQGHRGIVTSVCTSADGSRIIAGSDDSTIKIWNAATGACEMTLRGHSSWVRSVCISADGSRIISGSRDNIIKIWNAATGACEMSLQGHTRGVKSVCISADGSRIISGSEDKTIKIWNAMTGVLLHSFQFSSCVLSGDADVLIRSIEHIVNLGIQDVSCLYGHPTGEIAIGTSTGLVHHFISSNHL
jgi:WD40 repeat protein